MTLQAFINEWNGKQLEIAGSANAKYQCVDCANGYIRNVLKLPIIEWTNAQDFPSKAGDKYDYILNSDTNFPLNGDIVIWKSKDGIGHIAICVSATATKFTSFDQNWSKPLFCTIENHIYKSINYEVIGWLRCKTVTNSDENMTPEETSILKFIKEQGANEGKVREAFGALNDIAGLKSSIEEKGKEIEILQKKVDDSEVLLKSLETKVNDLADKLTEKEKTSAEYQKQLDTANKTISNITEELATANKDKADYKKWYESALLKSSEKLSALDLIKLLINKIKTK